MKIYAISDLHLAINSNKPMDIFGGEWENYFEKIITDWNNKVKNEDIVLISGDISWAMRIEDAAKDLQLLSPLPGSKIIIKGNHDYWWSSYSKVNAILPNNITAIQNNAFLINGIIFCGTRGWTVPCGNNIDPQDIKLYEREQLRLQLTLNDAKKLQTDNQPIILMMHFPPYNWAYADSEFTQIIAKYDVTAVIYGHLHGKDSGNNKIVFKDSIPYFLTSCDQLKNKLKLIYDTDTEIVNTSDIESF